MYCTYSSSDGRICGDGDAVLGTRGSNAVLEDIRREDAQLHLHGANLCNLCRLVDCIGVAFRKRNGAQLARVDVLLLNNTKSHVQRGVGVSPRAAEEIELLGAAELADDVVERFSNVFRASVGLQRLEIHAALDDEGDFVGVLGIFGEVGLEESHGVVFGRAVELCAVPERHAVVEGGFQSGNGLVQWRRLRSPGEA